MDILESRFQSELIKKLKLRFPGCIVLKNDPEYLLDVPDLIVLYLDRWAALEVKRDARAPQQPNQEYYVQKMNNMGFASFIFPRNEERVLNELSSYFYD